MMESGFMEAAEQYEAHWVLRAIADLDSAKYLYEGRKSPDIVIYLCLQSLEKILKSLWVKHGISIIRTHDLRRLSEKLIELEPWVTEFADGLYYINDFLNNIRYPEGGNCSSDDAMQCLLIAESFFKRVQS